MRVFAFTMAMVVSSSAFAAEEYCQVLGHTKFLSMKVTITVDYGERAAEKVRDDEGKVAKFNSMIDALNYMAENGWTFVDAYVITVGSQNVYHYMLKREKAG